MAMTLRIPGFRLGSPAVPPGGDPVGRMAMAVLRLAVLLQAGVTPDAAWRHLAHTDDPDARAVGVDRAAGVPLVAAIARRGGPWRELAAAWQVATVAGAPLADSLRTIAGVLRETAEIAADVRIALAEPAATARLMLWLPAVGVVLGVLLGFDTLGVLVGSPVGWALLVAGALLLFAAQRWTRRLVRAAQPDARIPGLGEELTAIALGGGVSIERAQELVTSSGVPAADVGDVLRLSRAAGVPAAELLRATAGHARLQARTDARLAAARLSTRLLIPLGVCTLPAFLCLGVAPLLLSVLSTSAF